MVMEQQLDFLGRDKNDTDSRLIQFKSPTERVRDFDLWWHSHGFSSRSAALNMFMAKIVEDERTLHDPRMIQPVENAINGIKELIPIIERYGISKRY